MKVAGEGAEEGGGSPDSDGDDQREGAEACESCRRCLLLDMRDDVAVFISSVWCNWLGRYSR
jgi:hypothetical protein